MGQTWLSAIRRYFAVIFLGNLVWEFAHLPLYTVWNEGTLGDLVFAAVHCTGGDLLIALASLMGSLALFGNAKWPFERFAPVLAATVFCGVSYTIFSEWLNIEVRGAWAYSDLMPVIPGTWIGLSPLLQWFVIPLMGFWVAKNGSTQSLNIAERL